MTTNNFNPEISNSNLNSAQYYIDDDGGFKFISPYLSSSNFDGTIPVIEETIDAEDIKPGMLILLGDQNYYAVVSVAYDDIDLEDSPSTNITVGYIDSNNELATTVYNFTDQVDIRYEDWNNKNLGSQGWTITSGGNAIFANVGVRGDLEATTLDVGGTDGIVYDGTTVTIGASVIINAPLTVTGNFVVSGSAAQDIINNNTTITGGNIATGKIKSQGYSGPGTASAFSASGMLINLDDGSIAAPNFKIDSSGGAHFKGIVQTASGTVGGFNLSASQISIAGFTMSTSSGIFLGDSQQFKVDTLGNLVATSASIVGNITANSGNIGGFSLSLNSLNATNFAVSTTGGLALGSASQFYVSTSGDLRANSASISGDITANSGRFLGSVGVNGDGLIFAGNDPSTGQRVILTSSGLYGYDSGNINIFSIPITGSPTIAGFTLINNGITGSGQMANIIIGSRGDNAYNITLRGDKTGGQAAAIYTVVNGTATTPTTNNGFYLDDLGRMRLAGSNGSLIFDGNNLLVTGGINATSGSFVGWLRSASITGGIISSGSFVGGILQSPTYSGVTDGSAFSTTGTHINLNTGAITGKQFRIDTSGNATFAGALNAATGTFSGNLSAAGGTFSGTLSADSITSGTLDSTRINTDTLVAKNIRTATTGDRVVIGSLVGGTTGDIFLYSSGVNETAPASIRATAGGGKPKLFIIAGTDHASGANPLELEFFAASDEIIYRGNQHIFQPNTYATTNVTISGNLSATKLYGDGSELTNLPSGGSSPTGTIVMYGGGSAPSGWLLCDGAAVSRSTYSALWNVLGSSYGNGNGSTTFNVPNFISGGPGGTPAFPRGGNTRGNTGGQDSFTLTVDNIPIHNHGIGTLSIGGSLGGSGVLSHSGTMDEKGGHTHSSLTATTGTEPAHRHGVGDYVIGGSVGSGGNHSHTYTAPDAAVSSRQGTQTGGVVPGRATGTATSTEPSHQHGAGSLAISGLSALAGNHSHTVSFDWTSATAGAHRHTITIDDHANHTHSITGLTITGNTGNWGTSFPSSINNQPPYVVVNFIIKT